MNIIISGDKKYLRYAKVLMASIYENHIDYLKSNSITFYILCDEFSDVEKHSILEYAKSYKQTAEFISVDRKKFECLLQFLRPVSKRWPMHTCYYLMAHELLPNTCDRALYLDLDIAVNGNILELYNYDFGDDLIIVRKSGGDSIAQLATGQENFSHIVDFNINVATRGGYFNSGVVLMNLRGMRNKKIDMKYYCDMLAGRKNVFFDQGILCVCLGKYAKLMQSCKYNYFIEQSIKGYTYENKTKNSSLKYTFALPKDVKIIHYCGNIGLKPWVLHFDNDEISGDGEAFCNIIPEYADYVDIWWKYARLTPDFKDLWEEQLKNKAAYNIFKEIMLNRPVHFLNKMMLDYLNVPKHDYRNEINTNDNLNDFVTPRIYVCKNTEIVKTLKNLPVTFDNYSPFRLTVKFVANESDNNSSVLQILEVADKNADLYRRFYDGKAKTWGDWQCYMKMTEADLLRIKKQEEKLNSLEKKLETLLQSKYD